jgi:sterol O-acyltransferase
MSTTATSNGSMTSQVLRARALKSMQIADDHLAPPTPALDKDSINSRQVSHILQSRTKLIESHSGTSTPIADDAPPSVRSKSSARKQVRARHRLFHTIDYVPRVSHFDPQSDYHNFRGFFTLFWIALFIMVVTTVLRNIKDTGYPLRVKVWNLLTANVWQLAISDGAMVISSGLALPVQLLVRNREGWLRWYRGGIVFQSLYQIGWLTMWIK